MEETIQWTDRFRAITEVIAITVDYDFNNLKCIGVYKKLSLKKIMKFNKISLNKTG